MTSLTMTWFVIVPVTIAVPLAIISIVMHFRRKNKKPNPIVGYMTVWGRFHHEVTETEYDAWMLRALPTGFDLHRTVVQEVIQ